MRIAKPLKIAAVLLVLLGGLLYANRILILVDKDRKDAWRKEPFNRQIRQWAAQAVARHGEVLVWEGLEALRVLPTGEQRLGR